MWPCQNLTRKTQGIQLHKDVVEKQLHGDSLRRQLEATQRYVQANELILDDDLRDLGVSAYTSANVTEGALGQFLSLVRESKIPSGSVLVVESLDRISRAKVLDAFDVFREIVRAGIKIHTLENGKTYTHENINDNFSDLLICLGIMARANEESERKSERLGAMWDNKHRLANKGVRSEVSTRRGSSIPLTRVNTS